jgi:hypothetical protein
VSGLNHTSPSDLILYEISLATVCLNSNHFQSGVFFNRSINYSDKVIDMQGLPEGESN